MTWVWWGERQRYISYNGLEESRKTFGWPLPQKVYNLNLGREGERAEKRVEG